MFYLVTTKPDGVVCSKVGEDFSVSYKGDDFYEQVAKISTKNLYAVVSGDDQYFSLTNKPGWTHRVVNDRGETFLDI